jgi:hypothetical protein
MQTALPRDTTQLLSELRFRLREKYASELELWVGPKGFRLYLHPQHDAPRNIHDLLNLAFENGEESGRDGERLRISAVFKIPLDDLIFGVDQ